MNRMGYTNAHRLFLHILTERRILNGTEVKATFNKCCRIYKVTENDLQQFVVEINKKLELVHLMIKKAIQEEAESDKQCFVLVNTLPNAAAKLKSSYSEVELPLIKKIIEEIIMSKEGSVSEVYAINLATALPRRMAIGDSEDLIDKLVQDKWLLRHDSELFMSALTVSELTLYLETHFEDHCSKCYFCKLLTFRGFGCSKCKIKVHRTCGNRYWKQRKCNPACPDDQCAETWDDALDYLCSTNKRPRSTLD